MKIEPFAVEDWMSAHELSARWNIAETCVDSLTLEDVLELGGDPERILEGLRSLKLTYGAIPGGTRLRELIAARYAGVDPADVLVTNGAIGANFLAEYTLVEPGDRVVCVQPTYQQVYSVPASFGAEVLLLRLRPENGFLPDLDELRELAGDAARLIVVNNPNNPTGALMDRDLLEGVVNVARQCGAYVLADEVYRGLEHDPEVATPSIVDLYEKGVGSGSMSKVFSLAGLRLGWIAGPRDVVEDCEQHRHHTTISCGMIDEALATIALEAADALLERNLRIVRENAALLDDWVGGQEHLDYVQPRAGTTAFLHYDFDVPSERFARELLTHHETLVVPGSAFGWENWLRVSFACERRVLEAALERLGAYVDSLAQAGPGGG